MRPSVIGADFVASIKTWGRSKGTLFWTLAFPIMLILIFGAIFSGIGETEYTLHIQDLDGSEMSRSFIESLTGTGAIKTKIVDSSENITSYIDENSIDRLVVIPKDYGETINKSFIDHNTSVNLSFYLNPGEQTSNQVVISIVSSVIQSFNMEITGGRNVIGIDQM